MSTLETVRAELVLSSALVTLVGQRIYPQVAPQTDLQTPYLILTVVSETPINSMNASGLGRRKSARLQVDSYGKTYREARAAADAAESVIASLARPELSAYLDSSQDSYEDETQRHRVSSDYSVSL